MATIVGRQTARDAELQLAAVAGRLHAGTESGASDGLLEELDGQRAGLAWALALDGALAPISMTAVTPTRHSIESEWIGASQASENTTSPAARYAGGVYQALLWVQGQRGPLVDLP